MGYMRNQVQGVYDDIKSKRLMTPPYFACMRGPDDDGLWDIMVTDIDDSRVALPLFSSLDRVSALLRQKDDADWSVCKLEGYAHLLKFLETAPNVTAVVMDPESLPDPNGYAHDFTALRPLFEILAKREAQGENGLE